MNTPTCPYCGSTNLDEHRGEWCDDVHSPDAECCDFYCNECGEGFDEDELNGLTERTTE